MTEVPADQYEQAPEVAVVPPDPGPKPDPDVASLRPGYVVFFDAPVFGESESAVFAGIVLHAGDGRARVHTLGLAADSADFPAADLRLNA